MARIDELRLMAKVARMYYGQGLRQTEIMDRLHIHQSTVSRLLKRAEKEGIVRITVSVPSGAYPELEEQLQARYALKEAVVVDSINDDEQVVRDLGAAAAFFVETTLRPADVIGVSASSSSLLALAESMHPGQRGSGAQVVQILGGIGNPGAEEHATQLTQRLANLVGGTPTLLPAPGLVGSPEARQVLLRDSYVQQAMEHFRSVTLALVGIGALEPYRRSATKGNVFTPEELRMLEARGAVGDICLRFYDAEGKPVVTPLNERVLGMELHQLRRVDRVVGVAGGQRKIEAIRGAMRGGWINVLITDNFTAQALVAGGTADEKSKRSRAPQPAGKSARV